MEDYEKEMKKLFVGVAIAVDDTELYCPNKWKLLNRKIKKLFLSEDARELEELEAERDALKLRVADLEQAFNYIKIELKEFHTVNCYPPINNYDPVIINVLKVCEVVLKNKLEVSDNE